MKSCYYYICYDKNLIQMGFRKTTQVGIHIQSGERVEKFYDFNTIIVLFLRSCVEKKILKDFPRAYVDYVFKIFII